jgi:heptosyltransferase-2
MKKSYNNILVIQTAFLGDAILATPLLKGLKELFPEADIDVLCLPQTEPIFRYNPNINKILTFDKRKRFKKWINFFKVVFKIRDRDYELGISIQSSMTSSFLMILGNIKVKHGFSRQKFLNMSVDHSKLKGDHKIDKILHLLIPFSSKEYDRQTEIFYSNKDSELIERIMGEVQTKKQYSIAVAPGSVWPTKKWPAENYMKLAYLLTSRGCQVFLIGSAEDHTLCNEIKANSSAINMAGKLSILQSAALIEKCNLIVTNDSAPLHMANAVKTDVIAIFGPTAPILGFYPYRENDVVIESDLKCRPCSTHGSNCCPLGHFRCMHDISVDYVWKVVKDRI